MVYAYYDRGALGDDVAMDFTHTREQF